MELKQNFYAVIDLADGQYICSERFASKTMQITSAKLFLSLSQATAAAQKVTEVLTAKHEREVKVNGFESNSYRKRLEKMNLAIIAVERNYKVTIC